MLLLMSPPPTIWERERGDHNVENQFNLGSNYPGFFPDLVNAFPVTNNDEAHTWQH